MLNISHYFSHKWMAIGLCTLGSWLSACQPESPSGNQQHDPLLKQATPDTTQGQKLTDAAVTTVVPATPENDTAVYQLDQAALPYIGRYQASIGCEDPFARCDQGTTEFIINLLPDGTAHRTFIHMGRLKFSSAKQYRKDRWTYDEEHQQIVLHRESGVTFYYDAHQPNQITMNLERIANASADNKEYFQTNPFPQKAYSLQRVNGT